MSLLGKAAVAMGWSVRPEQRAEFGDWHSHEHFPERMSIPGFRRGSRWSSTTDAEGFFVLYELEQYEVLTSNGYLDRLNAPTPWSTRMMPHHLGMVRSQCRRSVAEFVRLWLEREGRWNTSEFTEIQVLFPAEERLPEPTIRLIR